ncbi:MAG: hypothetical protein WA774_11255, partial [Candidatus Acidiferrales bacterium]
LWNQEKKKNSVSSVAQAAPTSAHAPAYVLHRGGVSSRGVLAQRIDVAHSSENGSRKSIAVTVSIR